MRNIVLRTITAFALLATAAAASAQGTTVPNTFTAGTPAKAAEVNANFQALATAIDTLAARVSTLEGQGLTAITPASIAGTYQVTGLGTQFWTTPSPDGSKNDVISLLNLSGTVTMNADGTMTSSIAAQVNEMQLPERSVLDTSAPTTSYVAKGIFATKTFPPTPETATYQVNGNKVTSSNGITCTVQPGLRVSVCTKYDTVNGFNAIFVVVR